MHSTIWHAVVEINVYYYCVLEWLVLCVQGKTAREVSFL